MRRIDLSANPEIAELTAILRQASTVSEPAELTFAFGRWISRRFDRDYFVSVSRRGMPEGQYKITRLIPGDPARTGGSVPIRNPWREWDRIPAHSGGLIGELIDADEPALVADLDLASDPVLGPAMGEDARALRAVAAMPTYDRGRSLNWAFVFSKRADWIGLDQFANGLLDINMMGSATRNLVALQQVETLNARLSAQLEQIATIQRSLLPHRLPRIDGYELATSYLTSAEAGGDYYDFFDLGDDRWGVLIADVAGHGAPAATVMAMLRAILHAYEGADRAPASVMRFCNDKLHAARLDGSFTTAFYALLDARTGELTWSRCGHNPPRLRRADGSVQALDGAGSLPLGIADAVPFEQASTTLHPGDTLVLYTDGITEAFAPPAPGGAREMFGLERLDRALADCSGRPACVVDSIHGALYAHTGVMDRDDDQTLVVVRRASPDDA